MNACYNRRVPPPVSGEVHELVRSIFAERSLADRLRGRDHRPGCLARLAALGEIRVVPDLLPLLAADDALTPHAARTVAGLLRDVTPVQLAWIDEQARHGSEWQPWRNVWRELTPGAVSRLAHAAALDTVAIGLLASHRNGFVRAAAIDALGERDDGRALPFLVLRANDWVGPVAARARELLLARLRPENRSAVLDALPFIVRMLGQRRRDHADVERAVAAVLSADAGREALARIGAFGAFVRRFVYTRLLDAQPAPAAAVLDAALHDSDVAIRRHALRALVGDISTQADAATLERILRDDPAASVRTLALTLLAERRPDRVGALLPDAILDGAASVRDLARFLARAHRVPVVPLDVYRRGLGSTAPRQVTAAIAGVGEVGGREEAALVAAHLDAPVARRRRAALRALARLNPEGGARAALLALADQTPTVRSLAVYILGARGAVADFAEVGRRVRAVPDPRARRDLLQVWARAPKWEAVAVLLDAVADADGDVRARAAGHLARWVDAFNRSQTAPTADQRARIVERLDAAAPSLPEATAQALRFVIARA